MVDTRVIDITVNNRTNPLKKHITLDQQGQPNGLHSELLFKKNDPIHTYIIIQTSGIPEGILTLVDENNQPLYSDYDPDGYERNRACQIAIGKTDVIVLPNIITENQSEISKNWKLYYTDPNGIYKDQYINLPTIKIKDFDIWTVTTPIYPNEELKATARTYVNTIEPELYYIFTTTQTNSMRFNADNNGVITFTGLPNQLDVGNHSFTLMKNNTIQQPLNYTVKHLPYFLLTLELDNNQDLVTTSIALNRINNHNLITNVSISDGELIVTKTQVTDMSDNNVNNAIQSITLNSNGDLVIQ